MHMCGWAACGLHLQQGVSCLWCSEPEALPFAALAYALIGVISTAVVAVPPVAHALIAITA